MSIGTSEEDKRIQRVARHSAEFLGELIQVMSRYMKDAEPIRNRILVDLKALAEGASVTDQDRINKEIAEQTQVVFDELGSPKVGVERGCVGASGGGITATDGGVTVKGCVMVNGLTIQGGGVEVKATY
jgi:hypothetical protein